MYFDNKPCEVCGSPIRLRANESPDEAPPGVLVGPADGVVGEADATPDERVCSNPDCPTNRDS